MKTWFTKDSIQVTFALPTNHKVRLATPAVRRVSGFTLVELLTVVAIIALLASILFPVFARARENARRSSCQSNLKQLGLAVLMYVGDYDERLPGSSANDSQVTKIWTRLDAYLKNAQIIVCPSAVPRGASSYGYNYSPLCTDPDSGCRLISQIANPAQTVLFTDGRADTARDFIYPPTAWKLNTDVDGGTYFGGNDFGEVTPRHFEGVDVNWADGHVKWSSIAALNGPVGDRNHFFDLTD